MSESSLNNELDKFLGSVTGKFRVLSCLYDEATLKECRMIKEDDADWQYTINTTTVKSEKDAMDISIRFSRKGEKISSAGVAVAFDINNWFTGNYLRKDIDRMYVFDHVSVKVLKRDKGVAHLEIKNPTPYDASVSILAEDNNMCRKHMNIMSFLTWPKFHIKAGETIYVKL